MTKLRKSENYMPISDFLFSYGLFFCKLATFVVSLLLILAFLAFLASLRRQKKESLEIKPLNQKIDQLRETLEAEVFSQSALKQLKKERKIKEKAKTKENKNKNKSAENRPKLFVLRFKGDIQASETHALREAITAILTVATPQDEVLVILESPGGMVHHYGLAASQLHRIKERGIPLTVAVDLIAASGGYLMASVANKIIAAPFAVIGSIGVIAQIPNFNKVLKKYDVDIEQHTAGEYKTTLTLLGKNTEKGREKFREQLAATHALFKSFVAENRPIVDIEKIATGEYWYGHQAVELKLIDALTTSDDYLLAHQETSDIFEIHYAFHETLKEKLTLLLKQGMSGAKQLFHQWFNQASQ